MFGKDGPNDLMRKGHTGKRYALVAAIVYLFGKTISSTNHKNDAFHVAIHDLLELMCKLHRTVAFAILIQQYHIVVVVYGREDITAFSLLYFDLLEISGILEIGNDLIFKWDIAFDAIEVLVTETGDLRLFGFSGKKQ